MENTPKSDPTLPASAASASAPAQPTILLTPLASLTIHDNRNESEGDNTPTILAPITRQQSKRLVS